MAFLLLVANIRVAVGATGGSSPLLGIAQTVVCGREDRLVAALQSACGTRSRLVFGVDVAVPRKWFLLRGSNSHVRLVELAAGCRGRRGAQLHLDN